MLCEVAALGNLLTTWIFITVLAFVMIMGLSTAIFVKYYVAPTYEQWRWKSNPKYPSAAKIKLEITTMCKGMVAAAFCPALTLYLIQNGYSKGYCGVEPYGWSYFAFTWVLVVLGSDFFEFYYHRLGHYYDTMWLVHKSHHLFFNPSPFAVIADEYLDQLVRASPLVFMPLCIPLNMDMMFFTYGLFFYAYGSYLHWGYEVPWLSAHNPVINTAFQHYLHHAISTKNKPYHTGFFFKIWDQMFGSTYKDKCFCVQCKQQSGERERPQYEALMKVHPDYSVLLDPAYWIAEQKVAD